MASHVGPRQSSSRGAPVFLKYRSSKSFIILSVAVAVFTDVFLYGAIVPVLPFALQSRAGIEPDKVQYWISILLAVYGAALLISSPLWGHLSDHISSRKTPFLAGLIILAGATALLCIGSNIALLIIGRVLQGISASLVWTVGLALVVDTVDPKEVGMGMGYVGLAMSLAILSSPLLAGVVYSAGGYYPVFIMLFGLIAVDIILRVLMVERKVAIQWVDVPDASYITAQNTSNPGKTNEDLILINNYKVQMNTTDVVSYKEARNEEVVDRSLSNSSENTTEDVFKISVLKLLQTPRLIAALFGTLVQSALTTSFDSTLPLLVKDIFHWTSLGAGLIFVPLVLPTFLGPIVGSISDRFGPKYLAFAGFLLAVPFLICLRFIVEDNIGQKVLLCVLLAGIGVAMALVFSPLMAEITWIVETEERRLLEIQNSAEDGIRVSSSYAQAYSLYNMAFSGGAMLGPIFGGVIKERAGWGTVGWFLGVLSFTAAVFSILWVGKPFRDG